MVGGLELLHCPPGSPPGGGQCLELGPAPSLSGLYSRSFLVPLPEPRFGLPRAALSAPLCDCRQSHGRETRGGPGSARQLHCTGGQLACNPVQCPSAPVVQASSLP